MDRTQSEKQYLLTLLTEKKKLENQLSQAEQEVELWKSRVKLASENGRQDLEQAASEKLAVAQETARTIGLNIAGLNKAVDEARGLVTDAGIDDGRALNRAQTDALVEQLQTLGGTAAPDPLDFDAVKKAEAQKLQNEIEELNGDMELEALRKKMKGE